MDTPATRVSPLDAAVESLGASAAPALMLHLLGLDANDRALRFCANHVSDETIVRYVHSMRFGVDTVLALRDDSRHIVAFAHGAPYDAAAGRCVEASFSVSLAWRNRGLCKRLLDALQQCIHREGAAMMVAQCRAANRPMRRVFVQAGMTVTFDGDDIHARARTSGLSWFGSNPGEATDLSNPADEHLREHVSTRADAHDRPCRTA